MVAERTELPDVFRRARRLFGALAAALLLAVAPLAAGVNRWTPIAPGAGFINTLAVAAGPTGAVYAATADGGIFRSVDHGATWSPASQGLADLVIQDLRADPTDPAVLFAATDTALYKTTDGGTSWQPVLAGNVMNVAIAASSPRFVYAAVLQYDLFLRLLQSRNGGITWRDADGDLFGKYTYGLEVDPQRPGVAHALLYDSLYSTANDGKNWRKSLPAVTDLGVVDALAIDPRTPDTLFAGTRQVLKSTDGGITWNPSSSGIAVPFGEVTSLAFHPGNSAVLYAGTGWGPSFFPGTGNGQIYKSADGGATWNVQVSGLDRVNALVADPSRPQRVLAATDRGVLRSENAGRLWVESNQGLTASQTLAITPDPAHRGTLFASVQASGQSLGVYRSDDGGVSWKSRVQGLNGPGVPTIRPPGRVIAVAGAPLFAAGSGHLNRSDDGGATWQSPDLGDDSVIDAAVDAAAPANVYAVGEFLYVCQFFICPQLGEVSLSRDGGHTFTDITSQVNPTTAPGRFTTVAIAPSHSIYVSGDLTFKSDDNGDSWQPLPLGPGIRNLVVDPGTPSTLYAVDASTVWKSRDAGATWSAQNTGLPAAATFELRSVGVDPGGSGTLVVATSSGVFLSSDHAASWQPLAGLETLSVLTVAIDPFNVTKIYAGTAAGGGLFVYSRR